MALERKHVIDEYIRLWKTSSSSPRLHVEVPPARFIYELCWTVVRGELPLNKFRLAWDSVEFSETPVKEQVSSLLADTISHMGQEVTLNGELKVHLIELAKWLVENELLSVKLLQERCEAEFLWDAEMIKIKAPDLKSKEVRVNTRLLYQQTKFNLLREESEGYAKLVTLLSRRGSDGLIRKTAPVVISTIKSLIGHFDLDPNRVFDIVLECYELQPENDAFLQLVPLFPKSQTSHILGFKFQFYQRPEIKDTVPDGLYVLAATLIKAKFIDLDSVFAHLLPSDEEAFADYEAFSKRRLDEANKIGKINLAATGKDLMEEEKPGDVTIDLFAALDMESEAVSERLQDLSSNQKLGLLRGFLFIGDWAHAYMLFERFVNMNPVSYPQICDGLFRSIENAISSSYRLVRPAYLTNRGSNSSSHSVVTSEATPKNELIEISKEFFQMLACAGPYLYRNALLLQKVCRVLRGYYSSAISYAATCSLDSQESFENDRKDPRVYLKEARMRLEEALGNCLLPSLQLLPANPAIGLEIWEVMTLLPYEARYRLYGEWEKEDERIPILVAARQTAKLDTRRILKRLAKENLKQLGRMVAKIAHANPMTVLRTIIHQIEAYKDMITPVVDAFKYLTQLEYDILEYVVIERLAQGGRDKLKDDGLNVSDWLQSLAFFWGHLCKKYPSMELRGLFQYLVNKLKKDEGIELVVLQELIQQMANVEYTENVTEEQLEAMAGGESLRYHATSFGALKNNKALLKSTNRLRDSLLPKDEPKLAIPLLLLIAQHRSKVVINADAPYIKMVSEQFDRCHGTLLQYVEFLINAVTPAVTYAQLVPPLDELLQRYHIEPEICFLIYRPILRLFKPLKCTVGSTLIDSSKTPAQSASDKESWPFNTSNELTLDLGPSRKPLMWSELLSTVYSMLPPKAWNSLSPELYITFWGLTLQDLFVPQKRYDTEIAKQHAALKVLEESSDNSHAAITKRKKDKAKIQEVLDRLCFEREHQLQNAEAVHQRLMKEKDTWLTSCPDSLKINMEFLQRCIFPRCVVSMMDAIYCARFVHTLHSLGTPFFNTVNHIDVLICKTLQPMICSCTEYEASRFGRFLCETLKMAYHWKSEEAIYEKECGNMPGFAVLYRDPNSARVTFNQYLRVQLKWSNRITKLLIQCLESTEYIEIRNALTVLTKISSVFPVTRKTGINLEKRVIKIKADEREDLKVLAIGVSASLAARKSSWVTDEEFVMGMIDLKPTASPAKLSGAASTALPNSQVEHTTGVQQSCRDSGDQGRVGPGSTLTTDVGKVDTGSQVKGDSGPGKYPSHGSKDHHISLAQAAANAQAEASRTGLPVPKNLEDGPPKPPTVQHTSAADPNTSKAAQKLTQVENEVRVRRAPTTTATEASRSVKVEINRDECKPGGGVSGSGFGDSGSHAQDPVRQRSGTTGNAMVVANGSVAAVGEKKGPEQSAPKPRMVIEITPDMDSISAIESKINTDRDAEISEVPVKDDIAASKFTEDLNKEKLLKRSTIVEEIDRTTKRRKGDGIEKASEVGEYRALDRERVQQEQRIVDRSRSVEHEKSLYEDRSIYEKPLDGRRERSRERGSDRSDRDHRAERTLERPDRSREDHNIERPRDRSMERFTRERSVDRISSFDRLTDRNRDERLKDERGRARYTTDPSAEQPHPDDRFPMQNLPPPPPLPPNLVPQSLPGNRREEDDSRRAGRQPGRTSPRRDEKRRSEEGSLSSIDDSRRKDEDVRDRKREDREIPPTKADKDRDRDKEKTSSIKEDDSSAANSKRRRLKRDHISSEIPSNFGPSPPPPPPPPSVVGQQYDRDRERKTATSLRTVYEEPGYDKGTSARVHSKDITKVARRDHEQTYDREYEEDKRSRSDIKRRHHRK